MRVSFDGKMFSTLFHSLHPCLHASPQVLKWKFAWGFLKRLSTKDFPIPSEASGRGCLGVSGYFIPLHPLLAAMLACGKCSLSPVFCLDSLRMGGISWYVFFFCYLSPSSYHFRRRLVGLCTWAVECCENCLNNTVHAPIDATFILREYFIYQEKDSHLK